MASIKLKGDTSGEVTISAPSVAGTTTLELPATSSTLATQNSLGVRNLIINGDMRIDQRNAGASVTPTNAQYHIDRWRAYLSQASKYTVQQSTTAPSGFNYSLLATSSSAYTVGASDYFLLAQPIEGLNSAHLAWGTSDAKTVTLSFWVRSSLTGTFGGAVGNAAGNRSYPYSYTISSADTWEKKTITIAGDTSGTWVTTNASSVVIYWSLGSGSSSSGTAGAWSGTYYDSVTGATSIVGTSGATLYITGVQLEVGTATPFEHRPYDMELARCQRYYQIVPCNIYIGNGNGYFWSTAINFPTTMRDDPSVGTVLAGSINAISTEVTEQRSPSGCRFTIAASAANAYAIDRRYPFIAEL
jgi:hypothetical protein